MEGTAEGLVSSLTCPIVWLPIYRADSRGHRNRWQLASVDEGIKTLGWSLPAECFSWSNI